MFFATTFNGWQQSITYGEDTGGFKWGSGATVLGPALLVVRSSPARKKKNKNWKDDFLILGRRKKKEGKQSARLN